MSYNLFKRFPPFMFTSLKPSATVTVTPNPLLPQPCALGDGPWQDTRFGFGYCASFPTHACSRVGATLLSCAGFNGSSLALGNFNLTTVGPGALAGLTLDGEFDLSQNGLTALPATAFDDTTVTGTISLADNNLTEVPLAALSEVTAGTVDLRFNPLLRLPSAALSPLYTDFVGNAIATRFPCKEAGFARFSWKGSSFCTRCLPGTLPAVHAGSGGW